MRMGDPEDFELKSKLEGHRMIAVLANSKIIVEDNKSVRVG